jgi:glycosyltransferase involved in cell wall biosynthesis
VKVCHITSLHSPFDVRIFHKECKTLAKAGHDVTLLAQADWEEKTVDGICILGLPKISKRYQRPYLWFIAIKKVKKLNPDIIHFHNPELLLITPFLRPAILIYDCQEANAKTMLVRRWIPRPFRRLVSKLVAFMEPLLARRVDAIVITEDSHIALFRKSARPITLLYNFPLLNLLNFTRQNDGKTIIHVGILSEGRGAKTMIEAMRYVTRRAPDARLILVGRFDSETDELEIRQLISDYNLETVVKFVGWVPFDDLAKWFALADVGIVPWQTEEIFPPPIIPTKLFEYMGARLPVVASDRPAIRRFIDGLDCGFLVKPGDSQACAEAIEYLLLHPTEAQRMGENGRRAVETDYQWGSEEKKLLNLYHQIYQG